MQIRKPWEYHFSQARNTWNLLQTCSESDNVLLVRLLLKGTGEQGNLVNKGASGANANFSDQLPAAVRDTARCAEMRCKGSVCDCRWTSLEPVVLIKRVSPFWSTCLKKNTESRFSTPYGCIKRCRVCRCAWSLWFCHNQGPPEEILTRNTLSDFCHN